jgi:hypothetical protein
MTDIEAAKMSKHVAMLCNPNPNAAAEKKQIPMASGQFGVKFRLPLCISPQAPVMIY